MDLNLTILEYVVEVAKCGSISKAAQSLFISQPHLSNQIKAVEKQLGVTLFLRSARGIELTREGKIFVDEAQEILAGVKGLQDKLQVNPELGVIHFFEAQKEYIFNRIQSLGLIYHNHFQIILMSVLRKSHLQDRENTLVQQQALL